MLGKRPFARVGVFYLFWWPKTIDQTRRISSLPSSLEITRSPDMYAACGPARTRDFVWSRVVYMAGQITGAFRGYWPVGVRTDGALSYIVYERSHSHPRVPRAMLAPSVTHNPSPCTRQAGCLTFTATVSIVADCRLGATGASSSSQFSPMSTGPPLRVDRSSIIVDVPCCTQASICICGFNVGETGGAWGRHQLDWTRNTS